jgi:hypothetical protein
MRIKKVAIGEKLPEKSYCFWRFLILQHDFILETNKKPGFAGRAGGVGVIGSNQAVNQKAIC